MRMVEVNYTALIVAAGSGSRVGLGYNKLLYTLKNGNTIIEETVAIFQKDENCKQIIVVGSQQDLNTYQQLFQDYDITYALGGETRQDSVEHGLQVVKQPYVLIHDGARPWLPQACIDRLLDSLAMHPACLLCVPVKDTIKEVKDGEVIKTLPRPTLYQAQTPQAFETRLIQTCYERAKASTLQATDDAQIVECFGDVSVNVVEGSYENTKVTTIEDIEGK